MYYPGPSLEPRDETPEVFVHCDSCDDEIYVGDFYFRINGLCLCERCVQLSREVAE